MALHPRRRIRTRLLLHTIPLIVLPILLLGFFAYRFLQKGFEEQMQLEGEQLCQMAASRIEQKLDECYANMLVLQSEAAKEWKSSPSFPLNTEHTLTARLAQRFVIRHSPFVQIRIIHADGKEMLVMRGLHPEQERSSALHEPIFMQAVSMGLSKRVPVQFPVHAANEKSVTTFSAPIFGQAGSLLGLVFLDLDIRFAEHIVDEINMVQPGTYLLFDDAGNMIAMNSSPDSMRLELLRRLSIRATRGTAERRSFGTTRLGETYLTTTPVREYIAFREPIPQERWSMAAALASSPLQSAFQQTQMLFILILVGAMALGIVGTILISRNITRPIAQLAQATQRFATGNLEANITVKSADEIGALTADFNAMASDLRVFLRERQTNETLLAVGRVSASLVHDLRNPVEGLKLLSSELIKRVKHDGDEFEVADAIYQSVDRLSSLLAQSLDFSRLSHPEFAPTDIVALANEAIAGIRPDSVRVSRQFEIDIPLVRVDAVQIKRVITNIVLNAIDACRENPPDTPGVVECVLHSDDTTVTIEIADNGSGISPERMETIFEPFFTTKPQGHGLGLSFARQIIKNHGGELTCTSQAGKGTRFVAAIPITQPAS